MERFNHIYATDCISRANAILDKLRADFPNHTTTIKMIGPYHYALRVYPGVEWNLNAQMYHAALMSDPLLMSRKELSQ